MGKVENKYEKWHKRNIKKYEKLIDEIYREAVNETLSLSGTIDKLPEDKILSFKDYPLTNKLVDKILQKLRKRIETVVLNGIDAEWTLANDKNNELTKRVYANNLALMTYNASRQYYTNNEAARQAFIERKEKGLNLSQRVWNYSEQFKEELEMGLDVGIRSGESADEISRDIRQYLKYPDKLFRRVRDEHGILQLSQKAKAFHPGQGVYRSSYKNARRLAATETNMAYRTSDYERWQTMDFVVGIQINLSNNHTCLGRDGKPHAFYDICDELAGKYPKTFKFTGWHPHCRCYVTTILKSHEEMRENNKRVMRGEEPLQGSKNEVKDMPPQFKKWVDENQDRIARAKTLPYFLRDNGKMTDEGYVLNMGTQPPQKPSILERAKLRHEARTPEQIESIQKAWNERKEAIKTPLENRLAEQVETLTTNEAMSIARNLTAAMKQYENDEILYSKLNDIGYLLSQTKRSRSASFYLTDAVKDLLKEYPELDYSAAPAMSPQKTRNNNVQLKPIMQDWEIDRMRCSEEGIEELRMRNLKTTQKECKCTLAEARKFNESINDFSDDWDGDIRKYQRGERDFKEGRTLDEIAKKAEAIEEFIYRSPKWRGGITYRGMSVSDDILDNILRRLKEGGDDMLGTASWSISSHVAQHYADENFKGEKRNAVIFVCKKQSDATSIQHLSEFPDELEILASKNSRYRLVKIEPKTEMCTADKKEDRKLRKYLYIEVEAIR